MLLFVCQESFLISHIFHYVLVLNNADKSELKAIIKETELTYALPISINKINSNVKYILAHAEGLNVEHHFFDLAHLS